jgi:hypothetical protein
MKLRTVFAAAGILVAIAFSAQANEFEPQLRTFADESVKSWISDAAVIAAIKAQNKKTAGFAEADIIKLDKQWRAETAKDERPLINKVLGTELSKYLAGKKEASEGLVTEIFVMDAKGLNVGQSDVTSDYWQGDEAKWKKTFLAGAGSIHISEVEEDESTQTFQSQVSLPVVDESGKVVGAVTVGVNVEQLSQ